jgi:hypothetical protein
MIRLNCNHGEIDLDEHKKSYRKEVVGMPRGDQTGPMGLGPKTGRGHGYCEGYEAPETIDPTFGLCWNGRRRRVEFGWRHCFTLPTQEEIRQALKSEADWLNGRLEAINKRIEEIEK